MIDPFASPSVAMASQAAADSSAASRAGEVPFASPPPSAEPVLCGHCGRTASNGISCQGMCVADSGY